MDPTLLIVVSLIAGFMLIVFDILFVPGGIFATLGTGLLIVSIYQNFVHYGVTTGVTELLLCLGLTPVLVKWAFGRVSLKEELKAENGYVGVDDYSKYIGQEALAESDLRPSGKIVLQENGKKIDLDCVTRGEYIEKGTSVKVVACDGPSLVVEKKETSCLT